MSVIALFIDYENVHYGLVNQYRFKPNPGHLVSLLLKEVEKDGNILIKKAYADWEKPEFDGVQAALKKTGVEPAYALSKKTHSSGKVATWKDSADAVLLLDALQTMFERPDIEQFIVVTGDRAALDLVHRLRSRGKVVKICALESALAQELNDSVGGEVISIEKLLGIEPVGGTRSGDVPTSPMKDGKLDWVKIVQTIDGLEKSLPFVECTYLKKTHGFTQQMLNEGATSGIFEIHKVANPEHPDRPTSAVRLKRDNPIVKSALP